MGKSHGGIEMFCPKCGAKIPEDSQFCCKCGKGVGATDEMLAKNKKVEKVTVAIIFIFIFKIILSIANVVLALIIRLITIPEGRIAGYNDMVILNNALILCLVIASFFTAVSVSELQFNKVDKITKITIENKFIRTISNTPAIILYLIGSAIGKMHYEMYYSYTINTRDITLAIALCYLSAIVCFIDLIRTRK